jgi:signal transduction histidine kinase
MPDTVPARRLATDRDESTTTGLTFKAAVILGLGITVGIWLFAGYYFGQRLQDLERRVTAVSTRYLAAQERLTNARSQILLGSVFVRDALLDPKSETAGTYRVQLDEAYRSAETALQQYVPVLESQAERDRVDRLRREVEELRVMMIDVLEVRRPQRIEEAGVLLRREIMPKRAAVVAIADELQSLNRSAFVQHENEITAIYRLTQRRVWQTLGLALAGSLAIVVMATLYAGRLERHLRRRRANDREMRQDLERLSEKLMRVQEEERRSLARELHDEAGQVLTALKVELALAQKAIDSSGGSPKALDEARAIADRALQTVRDISYLLHPAVLDDLGLYSAIETSLKGFRKRHNLVVDFAADAAMERLAPEVEAAAYRIVQEALTNVARHSQSTTCRVTLRRREGWLEITVEDDGVGFDIASDRARARRGLGLIAMRERAAQLGGSMLVQTAPSKGTRLVVDLPVASPASERRAARSTGTPVTVGTIH